MVMTFLVETAIKEVAKNRETYLSIVGELIQLIREGHQHVFVFGCGGTGKTTFASLLEGTQEIGGVTGEYALSPTTEETSIANRRFATTWTPPGQIEYQVAEWGPLLNKIKNVRKVLVVNVVSYGYHSTARTELSKISELSEGIRKDTLTKFLERKRRDEVAALKFVVEQLSVLEKRLEFVTLVTKQDLWWPERTEVETHYSRTSTPTPDRTTPSDQTTYTDQIEILRREVGNANFSHTLLSASLAHINMQTSDRHLVAPTATGYDATLLHANFAHMIRSIHQFLK